MTYRCKHFEIRELVDEGTYNLFKEQFGELHFEEFLWRLFDENLLMALDNLRVDIGAIVVNDWYLGGNYLWSGLRTPLSPWYSEGSMHSKGQAFDVKSKRFTSDELIARLRSVAPAGITRVELGTKGWVHIDSAETGKDHVHFFNA